jgi:hypothetical protein
VVPEWVHDATLPHPVRLIRDREHLRRASGDGARVRRIRIIELK